MNVRARATVERIRSNRWASTMLVLLTLTVGILIGTVISNGVKGKELANRSADATPLQVPSPKQQSSVFARIAKELEPSVVNITTESLPKPAPQGRTPNRRRPQGDEDNSPFDDFFDKLFPNGPQGQGPDGGRGERALGSGVIVDPKGYIVTNGHVVEGADRIKVKLGDDPTPYDAKVIGTDASETDLAVIKIEPRTGHPLIPAKLGNSESLQVGDWVLAIGNPFGLPGPPTVTAGIVSAKGRNIVPRKQFQSFIQTDAAINPGNSGGPLVDMDGQVVGINTAIFTSGFSGTYMGVGFAMPANTVAQVYNQLISPDHRVTRGSIGVLYNAEANPAVARVYGVKSGVTISEVPEKGPAAAAGLQPGDTIVAVDGKPVKTGDELVGDIINRKPGSKVKIDYVRNNKEQSASVTVADREKLFGDTTAESEESSQPSKNTESKLGITVQNVTADMADRLGIPANKGVIVTGVKPGTFGDDINVQRGDVIVEVNKQPANNADDFRKIQASLKSGQDVVLLVRQGSGRNAGTVFLAGTLP